MKVGPFELDDTRIAEARVRFDSIHRPKGKDGVTFDEYLELFANDCIRFKEIAQMAQVRRITIWRLWKRVFADLFPSRVNGVKRRRICTIKTQKILAMIPPEVGMMKEIAKRAKENGCVFEKVPHVSPYPSFSYRETSFLIDNKICGFSESSHKRYLEYSNRSYTMHTIPVPRLLSKLDFLIAVQNCEGYPMRFFVLPKHILMKYSAERKKRSTLYIPLDSLERRKNNHGKNIDFRLYEDAWALFKNPVGMAQELGANASAGDYLPLASAS